MLPNRQRSGDPASSASVPQYKLLAAFYVFWFPPEQPPGWSGRRLLQDLCDVSPSFPQIRFPLLFRVPASPHSFEFLEPP